MRRNLVASLGALALGWLSGPGQAQDKVTPEAVKTAPAVVAAPAGAPAVLSNSCGPNGCGSGCVSQSCGTCFEDCCEKRGGIYAAIGVYYIRPYWEDNASLFVSTTTVNNVGGVQTTTTTSGLQQFGYDYEFSPRVSVGYANDSGFGGRLSWWRYDQSAANVNLVQNPTNGAQTFVGLPNAGFDSNNLLAGQTNVFDISNDLTIDVWDLEVTQVLVDNDCWKLTGAAGVRYIHLSQDYNAVVNKTGLPAGLIETYAEHDSNNFNGAGPTLFLEGSRTVGNRGLSVYGNGRAGVLFGQSRQNQFTLQQVGDPAVILNVTETANLNSTQDLIPFLEVEAGVQFQGQGRGNFTPFGRLGVVGQTYWGAGNATSFGADTNLGFFGLTATAGVTY